MNTIAEIMKKRGLSLSTLKEWSETSYSIKGLDEVASRLDAAIKRNDTIHIVGDYDVDGIMATAIIFLTLFSKGYTNVRTRLPKRFSEGYGLSTRIVDEINSGVIITVDNGIAALDAIQKAKDKGLEVIVTDHHLASPQGLPNADLIVDPNAIPDQADWHGYCGAGIAYKLAEIMCPSPFFIKKALSLACIATIADSVPLLEDNRNIVVNGLKSLLTIEGTTAGLRALLEKKNLSTHITEEDIAFTVAPCLNAPGRLLDDGANLSLKLVTYYGQPSVLDKIADGIINLNEQRKLQTETALAKLEAEIWDKKLADNGVLVVQGDYISDGLLGLCAGKLAEKYKMPTMIFGPIQGGYCKGSVRTYADFNIKEFLDKVAGILDGKGVIRQYGGHAAAAGISIFKGHFDEFQQCVFEQMVKVPEVIVKPDIICNNYEVKKYIEDMKPYAPFGQGNPKIVYHIKNFRCEPIKNTMYAVLKEKHLKVKSLYSEALWFGAVENYESFGHPTEFDILGYLSENYFNGNVTPSIDIINIFPKAKEKSDFLKKLKDYSEKR